MRLFSAVNKNEAPGLPCSSVLMAQGLFYGSYGEHVVLQSLTHAISHREQSAGRASDSPVLRGCFQIILPILCRKTPQL